MSVRGGSRSGISQLACSPEFALPSPSGLTRKSLQSSRADNRVVALGVTLGTLPFACPRQAETTT